jgi:hypothetical protein
MLSRGRHALETELSPAFPDRWGSVEGTQACRMMGAQLVMAYLRIHAEAILTRGNSEVIFSS